MTRTEYYALIDDRLQEYFDLRAEDFPFAGLAEAMRYSLLAGGKRIRAILTLEFCRLCGGDIQAALPVACAIEMLHAYSLIHDDLPCMDNDDLRRGKPTNHVVYGECTAILAGDALQAEAFGTILRSGLPAERRANCAEDLANAVGLEGMCGGQFLDMLGEGKRLSEQELDEINGRKTGALLTAACGMGVHAAGGTEEQWKAASLFGAVIGHAFQLRDDMLDVIGSEQELGKPIGSDAQEQKNTYVSLCGMDVCAQRIERLSAYAKQLLRENFVDTAFLCELVDSLAERTN
ncbi:MAG: polyprenyl synthetase family protein [Oscillospiraceae bacterium]|nr:polyprenyl synthetase family protein [Oscillospiraceae bacterium]